MAAAEAASAPATAPEIRGRVPAAGGGKIVVRSNRRAGHLWVDLRAFTSKGEATEGGICLTAETWRELLPVVQAALEAEAAPAVPKRPRGVKPSVTPAQVRARARAQVASAKR